MNKKLLITIITVSFLAAGCGKAASSDHLQETESSSVKETQDITISIQSSQESKPSETTMAEKEKETDYMDYFKKNWIRNTDSNFPENGGITFVINGIYNGKLRGEITAVGGSPSYNIDNAQFEGIVDGDIAECVLVNDTRGNEGTLKLTFKSPSEMTAEIAITKKSEDTVMTIPEGKFDFTPHNLKNIEGFEPIENQSFMVDLDSWGKVKFVSGKLTQGNHVPVVFYLTNEEGDIFYEFTNGFPYSVDVEAVSFKDLNNDGLKDIITIVSDQYDGGNGQLIAEVCFQQKDGTFITDYELSQEINDSGNNKDIKTVTSYILSKK